MIMIESNSCVKREIKEFTETPEEIKDTCDRSNEETIKKRWRGELSILKRESYIEIEWKKIVQKVSCVKAMEFFVDGVKEKDIWDRQRETVRINKIEQFSLKVEVFFKIPGMTGQCYGPGSCFCFEATTDVNVPDEEGGNSDSGNSDGNHDSDDNSNGTSDANNNTAQNQPGPSFPSTNPWVLGGASGGTILLIALLITTAICCVKKRKKRQAELEEEEMAANTDDNRVYGVYALSGEENDYSTVVDNNPNYETVQ